MSSSQVTTLVPYKVTFPPSPPGQGRRSRRRRRKGKKNGSSGILVPSQPSTVMVPATATRARPSRRGQRRRGRGGGSIQNSQIGFGSYKGDMISRPPTAVSGRNYATFFKSAGNPVHKEWGMGVRYVGCSLWGTISSNPSTDTIWIPNIAQSSVVATPVVGVLFVDLYPAITVDYNQRLFSAHPGLIPRLTRETALWGKYVFRKFTIHTEPCAPTNIGDGFVAGLSHDVSWPLNNTQASSFGIGDIGTLGIHTSGALYEQAILAADDYRGDRTWPTALPTILVATASTDLPPPTMVGPLVETYYQYMFTAMQPQTPGSSGYRGLIYISYEIDFYSVASNLGVTMDPIIWNTGITSNGPFHNKTVRIPFQLTTRPLGVSRLERDRSKQPGSAKDEKSDLKELTAAKEHKILYSEALAKAPVRRTSETRAMSSSRRSIAPGKLGPLSGGDSVPERDEPMDMSECPCCGEFPCKGDRFPNIDS